jgi:putative aldouronate transport system permease protein
MQAIGGATRKRVFSKDRFYRQMTYHMLMLPACVLLVLFSYVPMFGLIMSFQDFSPALGILKSPFVGMDNFIHLFSLSNIRQVMFNTVFIASMKIAAGLVVPVTFALLLNEVRSKLFVRSMQTIVYLPFFLSWVILAGIFIDLLSPSDGIVNKMIQALGGKAVFFLGNKNWFPYIMVITDTWKGFGFGTIVYLAALTSIDPALYEAAIVDGANRVQQTVHITLPGIRNIIVLMSVLAIGGILNAGFDQIFNLYNPLVYQTGDILDTLVYRTGIKDMQFSLSTAVGLMKSIVSFVLIVTSYVLADKYAGYKIF